MGDLPGAMPLDRPSLCQVAPLDTGTVRPRAKPSDDTGPFIDRNQRDSSQKGCRTAWFRGSAPSISNSRTIAITYEKHWNSLRVSVDCSALMAV